MLDSLKNPTVIAAFVTVIGAVIVSLLTVRSTIRAARTTAAATKDAQHIAAEVKRQQETLSRLLVPVVAPSMIDSMKKLWQETANFAASQTPPITDLERRKKFVEALSVWYYTDGNGLFLSSETRDALFRLRCYALLPEEAKDAGFYLDHARYGPKDLPKSDEELSKNLRDKASDLRTALKDQLGIYGVWSEPAGGSTAPRPPEGTPARIMRMITQTATWVIIAGVELLVIAVIAAILFLR
ncbi:hypothetical protein [Bradyrhizobium ottawaense]